MNVLKIISTCLMTVVIILVTFKVSQNIVEDRNAHYVQKNPVVKAKKEKRVKQQEPTNNDNMISHSITGAGKTALPVKYRQNFTVYENKLYVTNDQGKTWLQVPDDDALGCARISDYFDAISESNLYLSKNKISVVYGGRGSENISVISTEDQGKLWSVGSIPKSATRDLQNGYDQLFIDFLDNGKTGYVVAVRNKGTSREILAYRSVDSGVPWDEVDMDDSLYHKMLARFGL